MELLNFYRASFLKSIRVNLQKQFLRPQRLLCLKWPYLKFNRAVILKLSIASFHDLHEATDVFSLAITQLGLRSIY